MNQLANNNFSAQKPKAESQTSNSKNVGHIDNQIYDIADVLII